MLSTWSHLFLYYNHDRKCGRTRRDCDSSPECQQNPEANDGPPEMDRGTGTVPSRAERQWRCFAKIPEQHSRARSSGEIDGSCTTELLPGLSSQANNYNGYILQTLGLFLCSSPPRVLSSSNVTAPNALPQTFHDDPNLFGSALPS